MVNFAPSIQSAILSSYETLSGIRLAQIVICMMSLAIFFSYCLQFYVPIDILLPWFKAKIPSYPLTVEYTLRYTLVLITCKFMF